jgi:outer membrane protein OmpA-like peptidoglycan-associated protein
MRSTVALAAVFSTLACLAVPAFAHAGCLDSLTSAADEVERERSVSDTTLIAIGASCHGEPAAALVNELVRIGRCDSAAQIGRSLENGAGVALDAAVSAADQCLARTVASKLDDLSAALTRAEDMDAEEFADLGSVGSGYGGGGAMSGVLGGDGHRSSGPPASRAQAQSAPYFGTGTETRARKKNSRASTGAGRYVASTLGASSDHRVAIADGAPVAWSRLDLGIWFDYDSAALRPEALATLVALATRLQAMGAGTVLEIVGHTDSRGSWDYNLDLSGRRAESVRSALLLAGTSSSRMGSRSMGESDPVRSNRTWQGRAQNRRVEFRFLQPVARRVTR